MQFRATTMDFAAGAVVFPGGRLDPADPGRVCTHHAPDRLGRHRVTGARPAGGGGDPRGGRECGVLLESPRRPGALGRWVTPPKRTPPFRRRVLPDGGARAEPAVAQQPPPRRCARSGVVRSGARRRRGRTPAADAPTRALLAELATLTDVATALALRPTIVPVLHDDESRGRRAVIRERFLTPLICGPVTGMGALPSPLSSGDQEPCPEKPAPVTYLDAG